MCAFEVHDKLVSSFNLVDGHGGHGECCIRVLTSGYSEGRGLCHRKSMRCLGGSKQRGYNGERHLDPVDSLGLPVTVIVAAKGRGSRG